MPRNAVYSAMVEYTKTRDQSTPFVWVVPDKNAAQIRARYLLAALMAIDDGTTSIACAGKNVHNSTVIETAILAVLRKYGYYATRERSSSAYRMTTMRHPILYTEVTVTRYPSQDKDFGYPDTLTLINANGEEHVSKVNGRTIVLCTQTEATMAQIRQTSIEAEADIIPDEKHIQAIVDATARFAA